MKNIVVMDFDICMVDTLLERGYRIVVLILLYDSDVEVCKQKYKSTSQILHIMSVSDIEKVDGITHFDYELMESLRDAQRKVEFFYQRYLDDGMLVTNKYFNALFWWAHIFDCYSVDLVVFDNIEHGCMSDIALYLAHFKNIPAFCVSRRILNARNLFDFNKKTFIPFVKRTLLSSQITRELFTQLPKPHNTITFKKIIAKAVRSIGGQLLVDFLQCLYKGSFVLRYAIGGDMRISFWYKLFCYYQLKKQKRAYCSLAHSPHYDTPFIFYAIHFEPEANTGVCMPLQNQLSVIQMLSRALPEGYKLYVKEHPMQFSLNKPGMDYYLYNFMYFKNANFYKEIQKLKNVEFISLDISSEELIQRSLAVATINGSIQFESTLANKPCIAFGGYDILLKNAKNIICVESFERLKHDVEHLIQSPQDFSIESDLADCKEFIAKHTISAVSPNRGQEILDTIESHLGGGVNRYSLIDLYRIFLLLYTLQSLSRIGAARCR
ncbi:hypothetical protein [uncultured Helicobacter sp.]|uniref:capsular polysaccharide export protein, LipB/KpsS family n=1 Tax=uncultured Helicobacter sp. TaxID=175537 RepID=UPI003752CE15